jgi:hypothetical protein
VLRVTVSSPNSVRGELKTGGETWDLSGTVLGSALLVEWDEREREREKAWTYLLARRKKGHGLFLLKDGSLTGFTYEGDRRVDPSMAP